MKTNNKSEQQLIFALNRLQGVAFSEGREFSVASGELSLPRERYFSFSIAGCYFAVNASCMCEVFVEPAIAPLPNAPELLLGLCNIRGILVPVYQLYGLLNSQFSARRTVFFVGKGEHMVGLLADALPSSVSLPDATQWQPVGAVPHFLDELVTADVLDNDKNYLVLDGRKLGEKLLMLSLKQPKVIATWGHGQGSLLS